MFVREDWTLFRTLGTLCQKAGVPVEQLRRVVVKELIDNALDAMPPGGPLGARAVVVDPFTMVVEDDGPGIPGAPEAVASLFSIGRALVSSKLLRVPTRGALGNGLRVVAGAVLASGGRLEVWTGDRHLWLIPQDSGETVVRWEPATTRGARVLVALGESIPPDDALAGWCRHVLLFGGCTPSYAGKTSPFWYDADAFYELTQAAGERTVRALVAELDGCSGGKAGTIAAAFTGRVAATLSREEASQLLAVARTHARPVKPERLGAIGQIEILPAAYARAGTTFPIHAGHGGLAGEIPAVIEAWAGPPWTGTEDGLAVFVNRSPIVGSVEVDRQSERSTIGIFGCGLAHTARVGRAPIVLTVNVQTPAMPITSDGKEPDFTPFLEPLIETIEKAARRVRRGSVTGATHERPTEKRVILANLDAAIDQSSGDRQFRYSQRQLYYVIRPHVQEAFDKALSFDYFCSVITDYEGEHGDVPGMTRDARGSLYHPHIGDEIALGTLTARAYARPPWTFNKILYSEKEGLFSILRTVQWPERHDCALVTAKGYASRAIRDVIDYLGETDEPIQVFAIHDADGPGTMIWQSLQHATRARPRRRIEVVNLGLEAEEALAMGLPVEQPEKKGKHAVAVADYVSAEGRRWYQTQRVELNAMTTPQFIDWLNRKMAPYDTGKVLPPAAVVSARLEGQARAEVERAITARVLREARVDEQVAAAMGRLSPALTALGAVAAERIATVLAEEPTEAWSDVVDLLATTVAEHS